MLNCAVIMGRLTADPELRTTSTGLSVTSFSVAIDRGYAKNGEEKQTDFLNVVAWRQTAEFVCKYFTKGQMIAVQGSIQTRKYEDKTGASRTATEIVASQVSFCGSKSEGSSVGANIANAAQQPASFATGNNSDFEELAEDDLPF
ncbi:MAG: single-stranded DNA-binding protein [Clostridiales bacterium]|nr:single-stranded DNA-binding protein [Clostridiales bacterium]